MRLGTCLLLEVVAGASLTGALGTGVYYGGQRVAGTIQGQAFASPAPRQIEPPPHPSLGLLPLPVAQPPLYVAGQGGYFVGVEDSVLLAPLLGDDITRVKFNRGGSSISLRIDFANGARASFKPEQTNPQTTPRYEVAAFRINRLLGMGTVSPAVIRTFDFDKLEAALDPTSRDFLPRLRLEIRVKDDGSVTGELQHWIPEICDAFIEGYPLDSIDGMVLWKKYLTAGEPIPYASYDLVRQVSELVVFDFLINNPDRWSGSNAKTSPDGRQLYFMDNTMAFAPEPEGHENLQSFLSRVQKFSRAEIAAIRRLNPIVIRRLMLEGRGPYVSLLNEEEIEGIFARRAYLLRQVDTLIETYGVENVMVFP